jgi:hypothetical protein
MKDYSPDNEEYSKDYENYSPDNEDYNKDYERL